MAMGFARDLSEGGLDFYGIIHSLKAIKTAMDINHQKAMYSPLYLGRKGAGGIGRWRQGVRRT